MSQSAKSNSPQEASPPARSGRTRPAADFAGPHTQAAFARAGFRDATLPLRWSDIAGAEVARLAEPVRLQDGPEGAVLTLKCESGAAVFLQHQTRMLIERLNAYLGRGRIARLKFIPGKLSRATAPPDHPARKYGAAADSPSESEAKPDLRTALDRLGRLRARRPARPEH
jgi:hypothetical protein